MQFPRRTDVRTALRFNVTDGSFTVSRQATGAQPMYFRVNEDSLRQIGDMDITEAVERARMDPFREHSIGGKRKPVTGRAIGFSF